MGLARSFPAAIGLALSLSGQAWAASCIFDGITPESFAREIPIVFRGVAVDRVDEDDETIPEEIFTHGFFIFEVSEVMKGDLGPRIRIAGSLLTSAEVVFTLGREYILPIGRADDDVYFEDWCGAHYLYDPEVHDRILAILADYRAETDDLERAIILDPAQPEVLRRLAALLVEFNEPERALPYLDRLAGFDPGDPATREFLLDTLRPAAEALAEQHERERALGLLDRLLELVPDDADLLVQRADLLGQLSRVDEALAAYRAALALAADHAAAQRGATLALIRLGRIGELDPAIRDFSGLALSEADPRFDLAGAARPGLVMTAARVWRPGFAGSDLTGATFRNARLGGADFSSAVLRNADLRVESATGAIFRGADLRAAIFGGDLAGSDFRQADLSGATLDEAGLERASFVDATLAGAALRRSILSESDFTGADLTGADLGAAQLYLATLAGADLSGANLAGTYLIGADLTGTSLAGAVFDCDTEWPDGFEPVAAGAVSSDPGCMPISDRALRRAMAFVGGDRQPAPIGDCLLAPTIACVTDLILIATAANEGELPDDEPQLTVDDTETMNRAATELLRAGQIDAAVAVARAIQRLWDPRGRGDFDPQTLTAVLILAEAEAAGGDRETAETTLEAITAGLRVPLLAPDIARLGTGDSHFVPARQAQQLAATWIRIGDAEQAQRLLQAAWPTLLTSEPPDPGRSTAAYIERMPLFDLRDVALLQVEQGDVSGALATAAAIRAAAESYALVPSYAGFRTHIADVYAAALGRVADLQAQSGDQAGSEALLDRAQQVLSSQLPEEMIIRELMARGPIDRIRGFPSLDGAFDRRQTDYLVPFLGDYDGDQARAGFVAGIRLLIEAGDADQASEALRAATAAVATSPDPCAALLANPLSEIAFLYAMNGDHDAALASLAQMRGMRCPVSIGNWSSEIVRSHGILAAAMFDAGRPEDARALLAEAKVALRPFDADTSLSGLWGDIAIQQARTGDPEGATITLYGALQDVLARPGSTRHFGGTCCIIADDEVAELVLAAGHAGMFDLAERLARVLATWPEASFSQLEVRDAAEAALGDIAVALAAGGLAEDALALAEALPAGSQARALARMAAEQARAGQAAAAEALLDRSLALIPDPFAALEVTHGSRTRTMWLLHALQLAVAADALGQDGQAQMWIARARDELPRIVSERLRVIATIAVAEAEVAAGPPGPALASLPDLAAGLDYQVVAEPMRDSLLALVQLQALTGDGRTVQAILETFAARYFIEGGSEQYGHSGLEDKLDIFAAMLPVVAALERSR